MSRFGSDFECPAEAENFCTDDSNCVEGLKCCDTGCEMDCVGKLRILGCTKELLTINCACILLQASQNSAKKSNEFSLVCS